MNETIVNPAIIELSTTITILTSKVGALQKELEELTEELASIKNENEILKQKPKEELAK